MPSPNPSSSSPAARPARRRRLVVALVTPLLVLVALELGLRAAGHPPPGDAPVLLWGDGEGALVGMNDRVHRFHPRWLWELTPGKGSRGDRVNRDGLRGPVVPRGESDRLRVVTLGDSATFGLKVKDAESWPRRLTAALRDCGVEADVVNLGLVGSTVAQGLELYRHKGRAWRPDVVVCAYGTANEARPAAHVPDVERIALVGSPLFRMSIWLRRFATFRLLESWGGRADPKVAKVAKAAPDSDPPRVDPATFARLLGDLGAEVHADGAALVLVDPPRRRSHEERTPQLLEYRRETCLAAERLGAPLVEVRAAFRSAPSEDALFADHVHPSAEGHRLYAEAVLDVLEWARLMEK